MPDLAPGFALDALEPGEAEAVGRHIATCADCAALVAEARRTAAMLPFFIKPVSPPPDARAALFARIAQADQFRSSPAFPAVSPGHNPTLTIPASRPDPSGARVATSPRRRLLPSSLAALSGRTRGQPSPPPDAAQGKESSGGGWWNWPGPVIPIMTPTVPLLLVLAVVGGWAMTQYNRANDMATYQDLWGTMGNVLSADDGTVFNLEPTDAVPPTVNGQVVAELDAEQALLMAWGLPTDDGSVNYGVWVERDGRFVSAGELDVDEHGNARAMIDLDGRLRECQRVIVSSTTVDANGRVTSVDVLTALITSAGPATGGDGTEGDQSVGSANLDAVQMAARNK
jgi:hypothetical protein